MSIQISKILKKIKVDHFRAKTRKKIFKKIYFFCKMLIFQDFSKFLKILKSTVQYLCRDISNVKIGLYLRSSHKKDWKTHFGPTALKNQKTEKRKQWCIIIFLYLSGKKKFENRTTFGFLWILSPKKEKIQKWSDFYV